ncbi:MAG: nucleotidyltransferase family protein [Clostridium sp.]
MNFKGKEEIIKILQSNEFKELFKKNNITNVIVFGSFTSERFNEESDIDIAIIGTEKISFNSEMKISLKLEEMLGREIDLIDINDESVNNIIKIEALKSQYVIEYDKLLEEKREEYDRFYKENEEFWYFLDKAVLDYE